MEKQAFIVMWPEHAVKILNGIKTLELRTWNLGDYVGWVNVYVTKDKVFQWAHSCLPIEWGQGYRNERLLEKTLNGKVAFRFWYDGYEKLTVNPNGYVHLFDINRLCLTQNQIDEYGKGKDLYAWHINKLEIFDKPKMLSDFYKAVFYDTPFRLSRLKPGETINAMKWRELATLTKAPQKMVWVYPKEAMK